MLKKKKKHNPRIFVRYQESRNDVHSVYRFETVSAALSIPSDGISHEFKVVLHGTGGGIPGGNPGLASSGTPSEILAGICSRTSIRIPDEKLDGIPGETPRKLLMEFLQKSL